jgi:hypothetical protein
MCGCAFASMLYWYNHVHTICHTIMSHDYTHSFRHPTFCKIVQLSSHIPLSVIFTIINPCIYLGGAPCTNLKNKTLLCLIAEKLCLSSITKKGEMESASRPPCGFWRIHDQQLEI